MHPSHFLLFLATTFTANSVVAGVTVTSRAQPVTATSSSASASASCISSGDDSTIIAAFNNGGTGAVVQLCPDTLLTIHNSLYFTAPNQELSTYGYPTGSSRATIQIAASPANNVTAMMWGSGRSGVKLRNIVFDGNRANTGLLSGSSGNIEFGNGGNDQLISYVGSKNPRGWTCMHLAETANNITVINSDIGPCGTEQVYNQAVPSGTTDPWADGISVASTNSLIANNTISGTTDGGVVLFGAPGTAVKNNVITGSSSNRGWGAINMVNSQPNNGNFSGVTVANNSITAGKMFNIGIAIGSNVWGNPGNPLSGPASITGNTFSGNITFPIVLNGWQNGITITGNSGTGVVKPNSAFADYYSCSAATASVFSANPLFTYWSPGVTGATTLQSGFYNASAGEPWWFLCATPTLPTNMIYSAGNLTWPDSTGQFALLHGGIVMQYQGDSNIVVLNNSIPGSSPGPVLWASGHTVSPSCGSSGTDLCRMTFNSSGNFATSYNNTVLFSSGTTGTGSRLNFMNEDPWISVLNSRTISIWDTSKGSH